VPDGPDLPDLSIRQFEYLVAVSRAPTWAVAAERVGVTPSALSQGLSELERRLGVELFDRDGRRRRLRRSAQPVLDHAHRVLALTGDLVHWADRLNAAEEGRVRLGMIDAAAVLHFPDVLRRYRGHHPDVELRLTVAPSGALFAALAAGELDLVVGVEPPGDRTGLDIDELMPDELFVYPPAGEDPGPPSTWGPWVLFPRDSHTRHLIARELRRRGAPLEVVAESHQPEVLREMVQLGMGWTVLPGAQAEHGDRPLHAGTPLVTRQLVLARRSGSIADPAVDVLAAELRAVASVEHDDRPAGDP
jgi:DNA-binding transcriptional LysR family regulator